MNILFFILFVLIFIVYLRFLLQPNINFQILNISISKIQLSHLFEKLPIVITESLVQPQDLSKTVFKYLYVKKNYKSKVIPDKYHQNKSKYLIIYPRKNELTINVVHPKKSKFLKSSSEDSLKMVEYVEMKLNKRQVLILPMYWWYQTDSENFGIIELDDIFSLIFGKFFF